MRDLQVVTRLFAVLIFTTVLSGCSIYYAATAPAPVQLQNVRVGAHRDSVVGTLGVPVVTEKRNSDRVDVYEFVNGSPSESKVRILVYIAGDLFTLGLTELAFWPLELAAGQGTQGRAIVSYGTDDLANAVMLTRRDGAPWETAPPRAASPTEAMVVPSY
ncbi:hypothetical protein L4X63_02970 [Geomonas sp. Red32]|nr:hypothetical protein [Geomonas sp. Red32]